MKLFLIAAASSVLFCLNVNGTSETPFGQWNNADIGETGIAGETTYTQDGFVLSGAGEDHWTGTSDSFHYAYGNWTGDCALIVRLTDFNNADSGPKAGIMFRATLDPDSPHAFVLFRPGAASGFEYRETSGGVARGTNGITTTLPSWLKLVRSQNTFFGYDSNDGVQWRLISWTVVEMPETMLVGLAVNSHQTAVLRTASFDNVQLSSIVPKAPSNVRADANLHSLAVSWTDNSTNENGFVVEWSYGGTNRFAYRERVQANTTNFTLLEENLYPNTVFFRVQAIGQNDSAYSEIAQATAGITAPLPPPWQSSDVGQVLVAGSGTFAENIFRVHGAGNDIGGLKDEFHYVYQTLNGNGEIVAFFENSLGYIGPGPSSLSMKAGLMVRQSLAPDAANAFVFLTPEHGVVSQFRQTAGDDSTSIPATEWRTPGIWLRLVRSNNVLTAYMAGSALDWLEISSAQIEMPEAALFGLAVTSHVPDVGQSSAFWNVGLTSERGFIKITRPAATGYELLVYGVLGRVYRIEFSPNLLDWEPITTQTNTTGILSWTLGDNLGNRFFRSVLTR